MRISVGVASALASRARGVRNERLTQQEAGLLIRAAESLAEYHRKKLGRPVGKTKKGVVTQRSKPGEYPRKDTGNLQRSVAVWPTSIMGVIREGLVRVGLRKQGFYGAVLEVMYRRLGFRASVRAFLPQLRILLGRPVSYRTN